MFDSPADAIIVCGRYGRMAQGREAWCKLESDGSPRSEGHTSRAHTISNQEGEQVTLLHTNYGGRVVTCFKKVGRVHCSTEKPARQPLACQPACLGLLQNTCVPRTKRLNSFRNHIRLIDNDHTSIYSRTANASAFIPSQFHTPTSPTHIPANQSMDMCMGQQYQGSGMTRTSCFLVFCGHVVMG